MTTPDPKARFTDRVSMYVRHRPGYPQAVLDFLRGEGFLRDRMTVADIGSGTGISSRLFLEAGHPVIGVEPNAAMRAAAEDGLADQPHFRSVDGSAEATTLESASVDLVIAGQAFHWFDRARCRQEFRRFLRPAGAVALFWNSRKLTGSAFAEQYESLLQRFGTDYARVRHDGITLADVQAFFAPAVVRSAQFSSQQGFDHASLEGRLLSSSYAPPAGHPSHQPMLSALKGLFADCAVDGQVTMDYQTEVYAAIFPARM